MTDVSRRKALVSHNRPTYASILSGLNEKFEERNFSAKLPEKTRSRSPLKEPRARVTEEKNWLAVADPNNNFEENVHPKEQKSYSEGKEKMSGQIPRRVDQSRSRKRNEGRMAGTGNTKNLEYVSTKETDRTSVGSSEKKIRLDETKKESPRDFSTESKEMKAPQQVDSDGWQTRNRGTKKTRNENFSPYDRKNSGMQNRGYQSSRGQNYGSRGSPNYGARPRPMRDGNRRQTVFYPSNRGGAGSSYGYQRGRGQNYGNKFGPDRSSYQSNRASPTAATTGVVGEKETVQVDEKDTSVSSGSSFSEKKNSFGTASEKSPVATLSSSPTITAAATIIRRPDLTPPPPPSSGVFSYRDILAKGLKSPSPTHLNEAPKKKVVEDCVQKVSKNEGKAKTQRGNSEKLPADVPKVEASVSVWEEELMAISNSSEINPSKDAAEMTIEDMPITKIPYSTMASEVNSILDENSNVNSLEPMLAKSELLVESERICEEQKESITEERVTLSLDLNCEKDHGYSPDVSVQEHTTTSNSFVSLNTSETVTEEYEISSGISCSAKVINLMLPLSEASQAYTDENENSSAHLHAGTHEISDTELQKSHEITEEIENPIRIGENLEVESKVSDVIHLPSPTKEDSEVLGISLKRVDADTNEVKVESLNYPAEESTPMKDIFTVPPPTPTELNHEAMKNLEEFSQQSLVTIQSAARQLENQSKNIWSPSEQDSELVDNLNAPCSVPLKQLDISLKKSASEINVSLDHLSSGIEDSSKDHTRNDISSISQETSRSTLDSNKETSYISEHNDSNTRAAEMQPFKIIPLSKRDATFPSVSQSWSLTDSDKADESSGSTILPQRTKEQRRRANSSKARETTICSENMTSSEGNVLELENDKIGVTEKANSTSDSHLNMKTISPPCNEAPWPLHNIVPSSASFSCEATNLPTSLPLSSVSDFINTVTPEQTAKIWTADTNDSLNIQKPKLLDSDSEHRSLGLLLKNQTTSITTTSDYLKDPSPKKQEASSVISSATDIRSLTSTVSSAVTTGVQIQLPQNVPSFNTLNTISNVLSGTTDLVGGITCAMKTQADLHSITETTPLTTTTAVHGGITPALPQMQYNEASYLQQPHMNLPSQMGLPPVEMDYSGVPRLSSGQPLNLTPQPHLNYVQPHAPPSLQYPNIYDPRFRGSYALDISQSDWSARYHASDREFGRQQIPQIHPVSQTFNMLNYPMQPQKDGMYPNYNYLSPTPYQQGNYRFQTFPPYLQRPPPPHVIANHSGIFNRPVDNRSGPVQRFSPESRGQNQFNFSQTKHSEESRAPSSGASYHYRDDDNSTSGISSYKDTGGSGTVSNSHNRMTSTQNQRNGNRSMQHPQPQTFGDHMPKPVSDLGGSNSWKKSYDKRNYNNGRKNYRSDHKSQNDGHYSGMGSNDYKDYDQVNDFRRKNNQFKTNSHNVNDDSSNKASGKMSMHDMKGNYQSDYPKSRIERENYPPPNYQANNDPYVNASMTSVMPPIDMTVAVRPYQDCAKDGADRYGLAGPSDYSTSQCDKDESQASVLACETAPDLCTGGWKYYNDTISSPSGLRIHQSTYVPYVNPCGPVPPPYLSTDVRARVQWLGYPKAQEIYAANIASQRSVRMDVTVVCSKGSAVCCNSDILGTCSTYFFERLRNRSDDYITIYVNIPSKIMKHFLQMMSCGEAFVPMNDVNEVIMRAPVYLNLNMQ